jgi:hypothetical protein
MHGTVQYLPVSFFAGAMLTLIAFAGTVAVLAWQWLDESAQLWDFASKRSYVKWDGCERLAFSTWNYQMHRELDYSQSSAWFTLAWITRNATVIDVCYIGVETAHQIKHYPNS